MPLIPAREPCTITITSKFDAVSSSTGSDVHVSFLPQIVGMDPPIKLLRIPQYRVLIALIALETLVTVRRTLFCSKSS